MNDEKKSKPQLILELNLLRQEIENNNNSRSIHTIKQKPKQISEALIKVLIESREESIWSIDKNYRYIMFNEFFENSYCAAYGVKLKPGMNALSILTPKLKKIWKEKYDKVLSGEKEVFEFSEEIMDHEQHFMVILSPISISAEVIGVSAISVDISAQKKSEKLLQESEKRYKAVSELTSDYAYAYRVESTGELTNEWVTGAFVKLTGYEKEELKALGGWEKLIYPEDLKIAYNQFKSLLTNKASTIEYRIITKDKKIRWMRDYARPEWSRSEKRVIRIEGAIQDITESKFAKSKLEESQRQLVTLMGNLPGMAYRCANDKNWTMEFVSKGCYYLTGYKSEELINNNKISYAELIHPVDRQMVWEKVQFSIKHKKSFQFNYRIQTANGKEKWVWEQGRGVFENQKELIALEGFIIDVTEGKQAEEKLTESEEKYRAVIDQSKDYIFLVDINSKLILEANTAMRRLLGYSSKEITQLSLYDIIAHNKTSVTNNIKQIKKSGYKFIGEREYKRKDGSKLDVEVSVSLISYKDQQVMCIVSRDITNRKKADAAIRENEAKLNAIIHSVNEGIIYTDLKGKVLHVNEPLTRITEIPPDQLLGKNAIQLAKKFLSVKQIPDVLSKMAKSFRGKSFKSYEVEFRGKILEISTNSDKKNKRITGIIRDITQRKISEQEIKKSEERYRLLFESNPHPMWVYDLKSLEFLAVNDAAIQHYGYSHKEFLSMTIKDIRPQQYVSALLKNIAKVSTGIDEAGLWKHKKKNGTIIDVEITSHTLIWEGKQSEVVLVNDVTEKKQAEERYRDLVEKAGIAIVIDDSEGKFSYFNKQFVELFGYSEEEILKKSIRELVHPEDVKKVMQIHNNRLEGKPVPNRYEFRGVKKDNSTIHLESDIVLLKEGDSYIGTRSYIWDISDRIRMANEREKLEKQLRRAQKLETIGTLAGGIAHDFNNILAPILGYTDMALLSLEKSDPLHEDLSNVLKGAYRAKELVEQILLFSKQSEKEKQSLKLQFLVKEALKLIRPSIPTTIEIIQNIDESCAKVHADATQIHQVIVNLCTNAWQAMEEKGGKLTIILNQISIDSHTAKINPNLEKGLYVRLTVKDTGPGMNEETLDRIFEPFYTTKTLDKGTGLGLSVVHGIVRSHNGDIQVFSEVGKGTEFQIFLPVLDLQDTKSQTSVAKIIGGSETILIVDDELAVTNMVQKMLDKFGYKTETYNNGKDALDIFQKHPEKYDLLISDLTMPQMTGLDLADQMLNINPSLSIIIMTGYGNSITVEKQKEHSIKKVLVKPIVVKELITLVRNVLDDD